MENFQQARGTTVTKMLNRLFKSFINLLAFKSKGPVILPNAETIPESMGMSEQDFKQLTNELTQFISEDDRLGTFVKFVNSDFFPKFKLDLTNPTHAMLLGYAFCTSVMLRRQANKSDVVNKVLKEFYPETAAKSSN